MAAVGQMAFTNYLTHTLICTAIFHGWGLAQFGLANQREAWFNGAMSCFRWWLLLLIVFLILFGTVLWWPVSPMWTVGLQTGRIVGFVHDGKSVMVWDGMYQSEGLALVDVDTGHSIQKKTMEHEKDWRSFGVQLLPDGKHFFCGQEYVDPKNFKKEDDYDGSIVRPRRYEILDVGRS